jgi:hypothetical protein
MRRGIAPGLAVDAVVISDSRRAEMSVVGPQSSVRSWPRFLDEHMAEWTIPTSVLGWAGS